MILARELRVGPLNIVEADLQAHRRFCNTPFVTSAGNRPRSRLFSAALSGWRQWVGHRGCSRFGGQIDAPSSEQNPTVPPPALDPKWQRDECLLHVLSLAVAPTLLLYSRCTTAASMSEGPSRTSRSGSYCVPTTHLFNTVGKLCSRPGRRPEKKRVTKGAVDLLTTATP